MINYEQLFSSAIDAIKSEGRYRQFTDLSRQVGHFPMATHHAVNKNVVLWCSNDYLGMGQHPAVLQALTDTAQALGAGAGGTRNISGTTHPVVLLEEELSSLHQKDAALVFVCGYLANVATLSTLGSILKDAIIFSDEYNHSSMIEGIKASRAEKHIFRHNDVAHLEALLSASDPLRPKIIAFESIYSMDGDRAPIKAICDLSKKYNALSYLDEVHAVGMYGKTGAGLAEELNLSDEIDIIQGTLSKAYGVIGGYIASSASLVDVVRSYASGFIFTTAFPPAQGAAALASVRHLRKSQEERNKHQERAAYLKKLLTEAGLPVMPSESHIIPVFIGDPVLCKNASDKLLHDYDIFVQHINFPTVPKNTERLRITPTPLHTDAMMYDLVKALLEVFSELSIPLISFKEKSYVPSA